MSENVLSLCVVCSLSPTVTRTIGTIYTLNLTGTPGLQAGERPEPRVTINGAAIATVHSGIGKHFATSQDLFTFPLKITHISFAVGSSRWHSPDAD